MSPIVRRLAIALCAAIAVGCGPRPARAMSLPPLAPPLDGFAFLAGGTAAAVALAWLLDSTCPDDAADPERSCHGPEWEGGNRPFEAECLRSESGAAACVRPPGSPGEP
jgi:hypothetical protein